jgi:predicted hydrocarbon binding protein
MANAQSEDMAITITFRESVGFIETLDELFGSGAGVILYHIGRGIGRAMTLEQGKAKVKNFEEGMNAFASSLAEKGWCEIEFSRVDPADGSAVFKVKRLPVPEAVQGNYEMLIRGMCSGFLEAIWEARVSVLRGKTRPDGFELIASKGGGIE